MEKVYVNKDGGLYISWGRDEESWDGQKYSHIYVRTYVPNHGDTLKMKYLYQEIIDFAENNNLTDVIGMSFGTSMAFGKYMMGNSKIKNTVDLNDYSENHAAYEFAIGVIKELFGLDLETI